MHTYLNRMMIVLLLIPLAYAAEYSCSSCSGCSSTIQSASSGDTVRLTTDLSISSGRCINFNGQDGITFDCQSHKIYGLDMFYYQHAGIYLPEGSDNNIIEDCEVHGFLTGIDIYRSDNNLITDSTIRNNLEGITLRFGENNEIRDSTVQENEDKDIRFGVNSSSQCNNILTNVIGSGGDPIAMYNSQATLDSQDFSQLILCNADSSSLSSISIIGSSSFNNNGLKIYYTDDSSFDQVSCNDNEGIELIYSDDNIFTNLISKENEEYGIYITDSDRITIQNTELKNNGFAGLRIDNSYDVNLTDSEISDNSPGISLQYAYRFIAYNNIINNAENTEIISGSSTWNTSLQCSTTNIIGGSCLGGNYWANPSATGISEMCIDSDSNGICDSPYPLTSGTDYLPLTISTATCNTEADTNDDGSINMIEIMDYIAEWKLGNVTMMSLMQAITYWKAGAGC